MQWEWVLKEKPIYTVWSAEKVNKRDVAGDCMGTCLSTSLCEDLHDTEKVSEANDFNMTVCAAFIHLCCLATCLPGVCQGLMPLLMFRPETKAMLSGRWGTVCCRDIYSFCILEFLSNFFLSQILVPLCLTMSFWCWISLCNHYMDIN